MSAIVTHPVTVVRDIIASGLAKRDSVEPLVSLYQNAITDGYTLIIHVYIPDMCIPHLDTDFHDIKIEKTSAGNLSLRQINIDYDTPNKVPDTFSLWKFEIQYQVTGDEADGIQVRFVINDPETSRGTVTTVATT